MVFRACLLLSVGMACTPFVIQPSTLGILPNGCDLMLGDAMMWAGEANFTLRHREALSLLTLSDTQLMELSGVHRPSVRVVHSRQGYLVSSKRNISARSTCIEGEECIVQATWTKAAGWQTLFKPRAAKRQREARPSVFAQVRLLPDMFRYVAVHPGPVTLSLWVKTIDWYVSFQTQWEKLVGMYPESVFANHSFVFPTHVKETIPNAMIGFTVHA